MLLAPFARLFVLFGVLLTSAANAQTTTYRVTAPNNDPLNFREQPTISPTNILTTLPNGAEVRATGRTRPGGWVELEYAGKTGWARKGTANNPNLVPLSEAAPGQKSAPVPQSKIGATPSSTDRMPANTSGFQSYEPAVVIGSRTATQTVIFVWTASSPDSGALFQEYVRPILASKSAAWTVGIFQFLEPDVRDINGAGGLLLCAPDVDRYARWMRVYLTLTEPVTEPTPAFKTTSQFFINERLKRMASAWKLNLEKCTRDPSFLYRHWQLMNSSKAFMSRLKLEDLRPAIFYKGRWLHLGDAGLADLAKATPTFRRKR